MNLATENTSGSLIVEFDRRQNEVLEELVELNSRIEKLLAEWSETRSDAKADPEVKDTAEGEFENAA